MSNIINIGKQFSEVPAGRYPADGPNNGEAFRENFLKDVLLNPAGYTLPATIILDENVEGYGSSFLNEAFGGLVRKGYGDSAKVLSAFEFKFSDEDFSYYKDRIISYINEAEFGVEK